MSQPIVLWNAKRRTNHSFDDAGISIYKTALAPSVSPAPYTEPTINLRTVPPLAYFCIRALTPYPDQLHNLRRPISYCEEVVRALVPPKLITCHVISGQDQVADFEELCDTFDVQSADPRLWATLAQVMHPLPPEFSDYELPLSDLHLPLLQQVPSRDNFCFVTLLALPGCSEVCDETINVLHRLNSLVALDLRGTTIGSYGLTVLARGLSWSCDEPQTRIGFWGLRILRLHSCINIDDEALHTLSKFPLLSSIDLRFTRCTPHAVSKHLDIAGFMPSSNRTLFHPAPLEVSLSTLEHLLPFKEPGHGLPQSIYACSISSVYRLHVSKLNHRKRLHEQTLSPHIRWNSYDTISTSLMYSGEDSDSNESWDEDSGSESNESSDEDNSWPAPAPALQNLQDNTTSSMYASRRPCREDRIRAAVVNSTRTNRDRFDPLALARPPPPWSVLDAHGPPGRQQQSHDPQDKLESIDHARLTKRHVAGMQDMVTSLILKNKRRRVGSDLASTSARPDPFPKTRNPFLKSRTSKSNGPDGVMRSVFAEQNVTPAKSARRGKDIANSMPKFCDAGALNTKPVEKDSKPSTKQLRPITSYPVPPCPIEHILLEPQLSMKRKKGTQTGSAFPRPRMHNDESGEGEGSDIIDGCETPPKRARMDPGVTNRGKGKRRENAVMHPSASASESSTSKPPSKFPAARDSHPAETLTSVQTVQKSTTKPLRPITSYPVPPCPKEHLLLVPQLSMRRKKGIQTELTFPKLMRHEEESDDSGKDNECNSKGNEKPSRKVGMERGATNTGKRGKQKGIGFDWNKWRRTTI